ncbi:MAG: zf-HC2 domain-containing protein [Flammeovirgaceae bacterium]|nr:zf-HC2 domain-containing protein [Flammeovirgaceae bacterium]MDW8288525.1 hypothetical protein [Flammeovirgaceae bacterium]
MNQRDSSLSSADLNCEDFVDLMQLIIDGEATEEEKEYFEKHKDKYYGCVDKMKYEQALLMLIKNCLKNDCRCRQTLPSGLAESVRNKVYQLAEIA